MKFQIKQGTEYIELVQLLKATGIAENGGHAKAMVANNEVKVNGNIETRKKNKIKKGFIVEVANQTIEVY